MASVCAADGGDVAAAQRDRRQHARRVAGVDAGLLDVLHHAAEVDLGAVAERVDVDLDGVVQEPVHQHRVIARDLGRPLDVVGQRRLVVDDLHAAAAEHVGRADQHRVADPGGHHPGLLERGRGAERRGRQAGGGQQLTEPAAVLGQVDGIRRGAQDRHPGVGQLLRQLQRGLPAQRRDHPDHGAGDPFGGNDFQHVLDGQRLEVQPVGGVVVGGHRLRVAVDHDGLVPGVAQRERRVHAGVVELDALPDPVRPGAQDDHLGPVALRGDLGFSSFRSDS